MGLVNHAKKELELAGMLDKNGDYEGYIGEAVLELIEKFASQGHSGMSASITSRLFNNLSQYKPITPLTGNDDEWMEVGTGVFQNNRMPNIFKDKTRFDGQAYNIDGKIFSDDDGETWYTNFDSFVTIEFPYMSKDPERIIVKERGV